MGHPSDADPVAAKRINEAVDRIEEKIEQEEDAISA